MSKPKNRYNSFRSGLKSIVWPALPDPEARRRLAVLQQYEANQWDPPGRILERQFRQLNAVVAHAARTVPFYRQRLLDAGITGHRAITPEDWLRMPLLTRQDIQTAGAALHSTALPPSHGKITKASTSGSTGTPVTVLATETTAFFWQVMTLREHLLHGRDLKGKMAVIRRISSGEAAYPDGLVQGQWGNPVARVFENGPIHALEIESSIAEQAEWLVRTDPDYLRGYPTNLEALARYCDAQGLKLPRLKQCITFGELVLPHVRETCRDIWGVEIADSYSSQEVGYISLQAPGHEHHLVQADLVLVEVIDREGRPCGPGEVGRVVITSLHNFAMPLLRYEIADFAEVGPPCPTGRGLPVLTKILGRQRNMLVDREGNEYWPAFGVKTMTKIAPIRQFQLAQVALDKVEARLVPERAFTEAERAEVRAHLASRLPGTVSVEVKLLDEIPRSAGGKYEDFVNETLSRPVGG
jgi:phenylacetate-coenzyme A ligase PaaK-like adenylate-forming protein